MKKVLIVSAFLIVAGCAQSPTEKSIKEYVLAELNQAVDDEFIYKPIETSTEGHYSAGEVEKGLENFMKMDLYLFDLFEGPDKKSFQEDRDREFKVFRHLSPNYEHDVMEGKLKDKSGWCTEIRVITEMADSLLQVWDTVNGNNPDYIFLKCWYNNRMSEFNKFNWSPYLKTLASDPKYARELSVYRKRLGEMEDEETAINKIKHIFTLKNMFDEKTYKLKYYFYMTPEAKIIHAELADSVRLN